MSNINRVGDLEINQDLAHQRLEWKIKRIGWVLMALVLLAALIGFLGPGPLSSTTAGEEGSALWAEYDRFSRYQSPNIIRVHIDANASQGEKTRLWLNREFIEGIELQRINPEPESVVLTEDHLIYTFNVSNLTKATAVTFHYRPNKFWQMPVRIGLDGGTQLSFSQLYYP